MSESQSLSGVTVALDANKEFDIRTAVYQPSMTPPGVHTLGVLIILERKSTSKKDPTIRRYAVKETSDPIPDGRMFLVTKPGGQENYVVRLDANTFLMDSCECKAHLTGKRCCHAQALRGVLERGAFGKKPGV